ncbi:MAG: 4-hydroxythreonine-4-phosphate dehydrogenase PdxA [Magnetococcales bacterium]|nr:4-hydroxythreonine-4-phosphate dehydrogenase PdxA [Magnetococcales bacterium]MBF0438571.1 4-hydroxythreonine-4-phosphate dehydrogenase PdxA [Magnetococcales bacterium]
MHRLPIAVTMGDPTGVGPEIVLKAFAAPPWKISSRFRLIHIGDPEVYVRTARNLGLNIGFRVVDSLEAGIGSSSDSFDILATQAKVDMSTFDVGKPSAAHGAAVVESIKTASQLAVEGRVAAMVTPPLHKASVHAAGFDYPGHTEMIAHFLKVEHPVMMLSGNGLRVVPATIHQSLASVPASLTQDGLRRVIQITLDALHQDFAISRPRIVVAGLNPHAGEGGAFGDEELNIIGPVCREFAGSTRYFVRGPLPADTLFHARARSGYDAVICMYHDQALIPLKMIAFGNSINVTLNLPIVRTSVDHGTAHDIAGQGIADPSSYVAALLAAEEIVGSRARKKG